MSRADIEQYFARVPVWMKNDIRREIQLARLTQTRPKLMAQLELSGGGNLLAALGLVAYSEALGRLRIWNLGLGYGSRPEDCFHAFLDAMDGHSYRHWRQQWEQAHPTTTLYETLRCGLVHEYQPKVDAEFWMGDGHPLGLAEENGRLIFKVEPYHRHFSAEADLLYRQLMHLPDPQIPPPLLKGQRGGRAPTTPVVTPTS